MENVPGFLGQSLCCPPVMADLQYKRQASIRSNATQLFGSRRAQKTRQSHTSASSSGSNVIQAYASLRSPSVMHLLRSSDDLHLYHSKRNKFQKP